MIWLPNSNVCLVKKIGFQNVVSKRVKFQYSEMEKYYKEFVSSIVDNGYSLKGPFFYSLNNVPKDKIIDIEMFFPILEATFKLESCQFSSYVEIGPLIKTVVSKDFDIETEQSYTELLATLEGNDLDIATPFYHVFPKNELKYMDLYLGYYEMSRK